MNRIKSWQFWLFVLGLLNLSIMSLCNWATAYVYIFTGEPYFLFKDFDRQALSWLMGFMSFFLSIFFIVKEME